MARPREFDKDEVLDSAIRVFREHGFEGTSTQMLVCAMGIGRQSIYDTFGDKWQLYCSSVQRYSASETQAHVSALLSQPRAIDGLRAMVDRVVAGAKPFCLGVNSVCEFGRTRQELADAHDAAGRVLRAAIAGRVRAAQTEGDVAHDLDPEEIADFLVASFAGIRIAARGGAGVKQLQGLGQMALRALR
jgi:AcrR family transcriptional regulator